MQAPGRRTVVAAAVHKRSSQQAAGLAVVAAAGAMLLAGEAPAISAERLQIDVAGSPLVGCADARCSLFGTILWGRGPKFD